MDVVVGLLLVAGCRWMHPKSEGNVRCALGCARVLSKRF